MLDMGDIHHQPTLGRCHCQQNWVFIINVEVQLKIQKVCGSSWTAARCSLCSKQCEETGLPVLILASPVPIPVLANPKTSIIAASITHPCSEHGTEQHTPWELTSEDIKQS